MRTIVILCFGALVLLAMEIVYSLQIQRYETRRLSDQGVQPVFFSGPITVTLKAMLNRQTNVTPAPGRNT